MTTPQKQKNALSQQKFEEQILVVKRDTLFFEGAWNGIKPVNFDEYLSVINTHKEFHSRGVMETDPTYKQIIPYLVFTHDNKYFLMQRDKKASEARLQSKYSLGIGGHIRQEDITKNDIFSWAQREFHEEVHYTGNISIKPLGILNDDTTDVGKVHIGFVLLLEGDNPNIKIKSELQNGFLATREECTQFAERMESWSKIVLERLT